MPTILPWSPSSIDTFGNCPRRYQAKYVTKEMPEEVRTVQQITGETDHKSFELRQSERLALPDHLEVHEPFMQRLENLPGVFYVEHKIALTKTLVPVSWEWRKDELWFRGIVDYLRVDIESRRAWIVDYKTGKPHKKWQQLIIYALHTFLAHPDVDLIDTRFYWTRDGTNTRKVWNRNEIEGMWGEVIGTLQQYKQAFKQDVWQMRPSGLCKGWCGLTSCPHWEPKRDWRG